MLLVHPKTMKQVGQSKTENPGAETGLLLILGENHGYFPFSYFGARLHLRDQRAFRCARRLSVHCRLFLAAG
jgi:hypothetical protein